MWLMCSVWVVILVLLVGLGWLGLWWIWR